jgi:hypothetical protein
LFVHRGIELGFQVGEVASWIRHVVEAVGVVPVLDVRVAGTSVAVSEVWVDVAGVVVIAVFVGGGVAVWVVIAEELPLINHVVTVGIGSNCFFGVRIEVAGVVMVVMWVGNCLAIWIVIAHCSMIVHIDSIRISSNSLFGIWVEVAGVVVLEVRIRNCLAIWVNVTILIVIVEAVLI